MKPLKYTQPLTRQIQSNLARLRAEHDAAPDADRREWWRSVRELAVIADGGEVDGAYLALVTQVARELQERTA